MKPEWLNWKCEQKEKKKKWNIKIKSDFWSSCCRSALGKAVRTFHVFRIVCAQTNGSIYDLCIRACLSHGRSGIFACTSLLIVYYIYYAVCDVHECCAPHIIHYTHNFELIFIFVQFVRVDFVFSFFRLHFQLIIIYWRAFTRAYGLLLLLLSSAHFISKFMDDFYIQKMIYLSAPILCIQNGQRITAFRFHLFFFSVSLSVSLALDIFYRWYCWCNCVGIHDMCVMSFDREICVEMCLRICCIRKKVARDIRKVHRPHS